LGAQRRLGERYRHLADEVVVVPAENGMCADGDVAVQVATRATRLARLALAGDADGLSFVHTCGNLDRHDALPELPPRSMARAARILDHLPPPPAIGARRDHAEHPAKPLLGHAPLPAALHADHVSTRLGARAFAGFAA